MTLRVDVRDATERAAAAELRFHDCYLALISGSLVRDLNHWSEPVQLKVEHNREGLVSILVREVPIPATNLGTSPAEESGRTEADPADSPNKAAGGWCERHGGYLGQRCATCALEVADSAPATHPYPQGYPDHLTADAHDWEPPSEQNQESGRDA